MAELIAQRARARAPGTGAGRRGGLQQQLLKLLKTCATAAGGKQRGPSGNFAGVNTGKGTSLNLYGQ